MGHDFCMDDDWPAKALFHGEFAEGVRKVGCPLLRYKDTCKYSLKRRKLSMSRTFKTEVSEELLPSLLVK